MNYRKLGRTGVLVSPLVLGTDNFDNPTPEHEASRIVDAALDAGINLIDTSNSYRQGESERIVGRALMANGRRDAVLARHQGPLSGRARSQRPRQLAAAHYQGV